MAYPTGAEIRGMLPAGGDGVTDAEANVRVERWKARLEFEPTDAREVALAEDVVTQGAHADAYRLQLVRDGHVETPVADSMRREAERMLADYGTRKRTEEDVATGAEGYMGYMW